MFKKTMVVFGLLSVMGSSFARADDCCEMKRRGFLYKDLKLFLGSLGAKKAGVNGVNANGATNLVNATANKANACSLTNQALDSQYSYGAVQRYLSVVNVPACPSGPF